MLDSSSIEAKEALDQLISKSRAHLYKPIQIAEILYHHRISDNLNLLDLEAYRTVSKKWRDNIAIKFLGRRCTSSAKFQDNLFDENAIPPRILSKLGEINKSAGVVEAHIYKSFREKFFQLETALSYCLEASPEDFDIANLIDSFWAEPGLKRSIDKVFEIIVYALFETLVRFAEIKVDIHANESKLDLLKTFPKFIEKVLGLSSFGNRITIDAHFFRAGVTNAADRGLDIFANFGSVVQIKHLSLTEELADDIVSSINSNRIIIVCKSAESKMIQSLLRQIDWGHRIQSIITIEEVISWYSIAFDSSKETFIGPQLLASLAEEIKLEFPSIADTGFFEFITERGYNTISSEDWKTF